MLSKIMDMFQIRSIIYRHGTYTLQTRILSVPDQEKLPKQVDGG